ncbi:MAG: hypothetical protein ACI9LM_004232 [Alteromonadaceae bacterium]|jgi:hypothetical protein
MKKLVLIVVVIIAIWSKYNQKAIPVEQEVDTAPTIVKQTFPKTNKTQFTCDGRQHCSQMTSYEEAKYFIQHCPDTKMDGDHDGIPCERQFGR